MYHCPAGVTEAIPVEYREIAGALFPPASCPRKEDALTFAETLGIGTDYRRLLAGKPCGPEIRQFMGHFQNNLDLLIQKTWVEKADEIRKEKLLDRIPAFITGIAAGDYRQALVEFSSILEELSYLFFGPESRQEDFTEYTFRIDTQMGLFWWYGTQIGHLDRQVDQESLWPVLLVGICYLTNF
jgi:hypothetical protein